MIRTQGRSFSGSESQRGDDSISKDLCRRLLESLASELATFQSLARKRAYCLRNNVIRTDKCKPYTTCICLSAAALRSGPLMTPSLTITSACANLQLAAPFSIKSSFASTALVPPFPGKVAEQAQARPPRKEPPVWPQDGVEERATGDAASQPANPSAPSSPCIAVRWRYATAKAHTTPAIIARADPRRPSPPMQWLWGHSWAHHLQQGRTRPCNWCKSRQFGASGEPLPCLRCSLPASAAVLIPAVVKSSLK